MDATTKPLIETIGDAGYSVMTGADSEGNSVVEASNEATGERRDHFPAPAPADCRGHRVAGVFGRLRLAILVPLCPLFLGFRRPDVCGDERTRVGEVVFAR
jgi:hypothetical protein